MYLFFFICSISIKYFYLGEIDGIRFLVICEVVFGKCMDLYKKDFFLVEVLSGYDSVYGVLGIVIVFTDFEVFMLKNR